MGDASANLLKILDEASAKNRKAKLIFFYEWVITGEWEGTRKKSENNLTNLYDFLHQGCVTNLRSVT